MVARIFSSRQHLLHAIYIHLTDVLIYLLSEVQPQNRIDWENETDDEIDLDWEREREGGRESKEKRPSLKFLN